MDPITNNETCKYKHEELGCESDEYKFIKNFYETNHDFSPLNSLQNTKLVAPNNLKVYKISENSPTTIIEEKCNNLMLFHGTNERNVNGILNKGFINSVQGRLGKGVYMTECASTARSHSLKNTNGNTSNTCIFVNEVLESEKMQISKLYNRKTDFEPDHKFEIHAPFSSKTAIKDYKKDALGRRYRNGVNDWLGFALFDVFLADESLVIPRFLIVVASDELIVEDLD